MTTIPLAVPLIPFSRVQGRMIRLWDPFRRNSHIVVYGFTGSGKSHLIRYGILPLRRYSRTVVIDMKDDRDSTWSGFGTPVAELPPMFFDSGDFSRWRIIVDRSNPQSQLRRVLDQIRTEGHCVVVLDETRSVTEREQAGLGSVVENLITEGRGLGVSMIMGAQSLAWATSALKDQPATMFVGQLGGEQPLAVAKLIGHGRELAATIRGLPEHRFLYHDRWPGGPMLALTDSPPLPRAA